MKAQKKHHKLLLENAERVKAQRRDLRHQRAVIRSYSENEDNSRLTSYLDTLITEIPSEHGIIYCENTAVNAVVSHYAALAENHGIKLNIPEHTEQISGSTLYVILSMNTGIPILKCRGIYQKTNLEVEGGANF